MRLPAVDGLPPFAKVRQRFATEAIGDVGAVVAAQLDKLPLSAAIKPGMTVAITAGSRGIARIDEVIRSVVARLRAVGADPFIVPAMGSHGGATTAGQIELIAEYGITEAGVGAPIRATMETVVVGRAANGATVHLDRHAAEADAIVVVARVKPHTGFRAPIESGLCKMIAVGLGKQRGAEQMHQYGLAETIVDAASQTLSTGKIAFGVAIVENAYDQPYRIEAMTPARLIDADRELLTLAKSLLPKVPFDPLDLLVVDWLGKNVSGAGMDPNILGMWRRIGGEQRPYFDKIAVLGLTPESHGNAIGIGSADFTTRRLVDNIDYHKTYMNALTARLPSAARAPVTLANDFECLTVALKTSTATTSPRIARIKNTLQLDELWVSEALLSEVSADSTLEQVTEPAPLPFDPAGFLALM